MKKKMPIFKMLLFILVIVNLLIILEKVVIPRIENKRLEKERAAQKNQISEDYTYIPEVDEGEPIDVSKLGEYDRMTMYFSKYIRCIEERKYQQAYDYLYDGFKQNYFPTLEDYVKYILEKDLPTIMSIEYKNCYRQGEYFILDVKISDAMGVSDEVIPQLIVIKEYAANDFVLSFEMN